MTRLRSCREDVARVIEAAQSFFPQEVGSVPPQARVSDSLYRFCSVRVLSATLLELFVRKL